MYIKINSIKDIDLRKISVGNINNRYIDIEGNRYATRFNLRTRKIDIIRIALGVDEARDAKKKGKVDTEIDEIDNTFSSEVPEKARYKIPDWINKENIQPLENVENQGMLTAIQGEAEKYLERIRGIISNVKNSEMFDKGIDSNDFILEITNFYDREISEPMDKVQNIIVEMMRFPKSNDYYLTIVSNAQKKWIEDKDEQLKKDYFTAFFVGSDYILALEKINNLLNIVKEVSDRLPPLETVPVKKKFLDDALVASDFIRNNIRLEAAKILGWMKLNKVF
ncbi:MAG: hypothetical protein OEZ22_05585 [Spirochaetia bacterium]|nr:hypothetical protein [Spirochaetia bacterium]